MRKAGILAGFLILAAVVLLAVFALRADDDGIALPVADVSSAPVVEPQRSVAERTVHGASESRSTIDPPAAEAAFACEIRGLVMAPHPGSVRVELFDTEPAARAADEGAVALTSPDAEGRFVLRAPREGRYFLRGLADDTRADLLVIEIPSEMRETTATLFLEPSEGIRGVVLDPGGQAVPGAVIAGRSDPHCPAEIVTTDAMGRFRLAECGPRMDILVTKAGFAPESSSVIGSKTEPFVVRLVRAARIAGVVLDRTTGKPIEGAALIAFGRRVCAYPVARTVTDRNGAFEFPAIDSRPGAVGFLVEKDGMTQEPTYPAFDAEDPRIIAYDGSAPLELMMRPAPSVTLHVPAEVRELAKSRTLRLVRILPLISRDAGGESAATMTDDGSFRFPHVATGRYRVVPDDPSLDRRILRDPAEEDEFGLLRPTDLIIVAGEPVEADLLLARRRTIACRVVDDAGHPIAGAHIRMTPLDDARSPTMRESDANGLCEFAHADVFRTIEVSASSRSHAHAATTRVEPGGEPRTIELRLPAGQRLHGVLRLPGGGGAGVPLMARAVAGGAPGDVLERKAITGADGAFSFPPIAGERWRIVLGERNPENVCLPYPGYVVVEDADRPVEVAAVLAERIRGVVRRPDGKPAAYAVVEFKPTDVQGDDASLRVLADLNGAFRSPPLPTDRRWTASVWMGLFDEERGDEVRAARQRFQANADSIDESRFPLLHWAESRNLLPGATEIELALKPVTNGMDDR